MAQIRIKYHVKLEQKAIKGKEKYVCTSRKAILLMFLSVYKN
jgi:hypothetical protein